VREIVKGSRVVGTPLEGAVIECEGSGWIVENGVLEER
jgi:hypothetical protein